MRRWFLLGLCSIASAGGACSSRSLLVIKVTSSETITGSPDVTVTQDKMVKRHYPNSIADKAVLVLDDNDEHSFGIYLPDDVSGSVRVSVTLTAPPEGCRTWNGSETTSVSPGSTTTVEIGLISTSTCQPTPANDAGADADGADATDASSDDGRADGGHGDAGADAACPADTSATPAVTCEDYCTLYKANCPDFDPNTTEQCTAACLNAGWPAGTAGEATGDTISCRLTQARTAASPGLRAMFCPFASANSEVCK